MLISASPSIHFREDLGDGSEPEAFGDLFASTFHLEEGMLNP